MLLKEPRDIVDIEELNALIDSCLEKVAKARERMKEVDGRTCVVCCDARSCVVLRPCKHLCMCDACAEKVETCPICRTKIEEREQIFV